MFKNQPMKSNLRVLGKGIQTAGNHGEMTRERVFIQMRILPRLRKSFFLVEEQKLT